MARIRTIKPEFWSDRDIARLPLLARHLFIATWNFADDEGLIEWTPEYLKSQAFPYDHDMPLSDVEAAMGEIVKQGFVHAYQRRTSRHPVGWVVGLRHHQRIDKPQPGKRYAPPSLQDPETVEMYGRRDRMTCGICKDEIADEDLTVARITPREEGGTDYPTNVHAVHKACVQGEQLSPPEIPDDSKSIPRTFQDHSGSTRRGKGREGKGNLLKPLRVNSTGNPQAVENPPASGVTPIKPTASTVGVDDPQKNLKPQSPLDKHTQLVKRLEGACEGNNRTRVHAEAVEVVAWASAALSPHVIDEEIGRYLAGNKPLVLPRGIAKALVARAEQAGVRLVDFHPPPVFRTA